MLNHPSLVVFCRRPEPGVGKQRIAADFGAETAFGLAGHLLATTLEDAAEWPGSVILAPASERDAIWASNLLSRPTKVVPQPEGNLGHRINTVDKLIRAAGHSRPVYIGSDAPVLDAEYYACTLTAMTQFDVVLGPADDGGVVLMGARHAWPELADLPWSHAELGHALELVCKEADLTVYSLDTRYDIDRGADLPRLYDDLELDSRPARRKLRHWLAQERLTARDPTGSRPASQPGTSKRT